MAYGDWVVGGVIPSWIIEADYSGIKEGTIILRCLAAKDFLDGEDPRLEIKVFEEMSCQAISNTMLLNGGSCIQVTGGEMIMVSDGVNTWDAALHPPRYLEGSGANKEIEFELEISIELTPRGGSNYYVPNYRSYSNIVYHEWINSDGSTSDADPNVSGAYGTELGYAKITELRNVKRVELYGSACNLPASITVNGKTLNWHYCHDPGCTVYGFEKLTFDITPSKEILITTTPHESDDTPNHGAWIQWIRMVYE